MSVVLLFSMIIALLLIGVPIAVALGFSSMMFLLLFSDTSLASIAQSFYQAEAGHYTLLAIPFFILASSFMSTGGVAKRIIRFSIACVGHLRGGLAIAGVFACMIFAALSGSSPATVVAIGTSLPELVTTITAARRGQGDLAIGGIVGSNIYNVSFVWGLSVTIEPSSMPPGGVLDLVVMTTLSLFLLPMVISQDRLGRMEGSFLLLLYAAYVGWLVIRAAG